MKYLATEMTAVLGHSIQDGKFLHLFREFAGFDCYASGYLNEVRERETRRKLEVNLLSPLNLRHLLVTMKALVVHYISSEVASQSAFSVINDGTQDVSKKDAQAVLLRYVTVNDGVVRPVERLVEVFTTGDSTGQGLCNKLIEIFSELNLNFEWLVGQSYDGAGNVSGKYCGLKTRILELADKAFYVWCHAHRLNLVVEAVLRGSADICGTLGLLQELHNFFSGYKRHVAFVEAQEGAEHIHTLKRVSDTTRSWRSAEDGVNTVLECYSAVISALEEISSQPGDTGTVNLAASLLHRLQEFEVIVCLFILQSILRITGPVSRLLQGFPDPTPTDIDGLCSFYKVDPTAVAREVSTFRPLYRQMHTLVSVADLVPKDVKQEMTHEEDGNHDDEEYPRDECLNTWANHAFIKPLRAIMELSGFPVLTWLYKILVTLAVTSCSAERAMSRVKIIKSRLRSTMLDDWFSSLMILASEKDVVDKLSVDNIIDSFAGSSAPLQKLLLQNYARKYRLFRPLCLVTDCTGQLIYLCYTFKTFRFLCFVRRGVNYGGTGGTCPPQNL